MFWYVRAVMLGIVIVIGGAVVGDVLGGALIAVGCVLLVVGLPFLGRDVWRDGR